ncbi:MAG: malate:quinone oxidoreductase [Planctomycetaceae bacterium]|nr:malate:quinone oxidoreductase [Planctomycetaceae bacterium]
MSILEWSETPDVVVVGSGIMSATLAVMIKRLEPRIRLQMIETTSELAREASDGWNNAGTGHAGLCELSYTPNRNADGQVPIHRALNIFEQFEQSKQFWGSLVESQIVGEPRDFINSVPHICFLTGNQGVDFLRARHQAMRDHHFFRNMSWTEDPAEIESWAPLVMEGRGSGPVAATNGLGTEVNYGLLARRMCEWLRRQEGCAIASGWRATRLRREPGSWRVETTCVESKEVRNQRAKFVFVGAGGGSLPLLQSTGLAEFRGLGGFPIAGQWLVCDEPNIVARHDAKVYGATPPSAPSLGAGHLDVRRLDGRRQLMFGPFASWTTRFLKQSGRWSDLPRSLRWENLTTLLRAGLKNRSLVQYLIGQGLQSMDQRLKTLREFFPKASPDHWRLVQAGIRVQTIKQADRGAIYFGTEVLSAQDRSLAALLGASPGASVAVSIALDVVRTCLPEFLASSEGHQRMKQMMITYDQDLKSAAHAKLFERSTRAAAERLRLGVK